MKRITIKQKIILVLFGLILSLVLLELGLRIAGFFSLATQTIPNTLFGLNEDKNTYTILAIGESTTAPLYNDRNWPRELEIILNNGSNNTKFKVISYGIPGSNTGYLLSSLRDNLVKYDPDMVITMMGINDKLFGIDYIYNESVKNQILLSFDDFRIFKLGKFIWQSLKNKFPNQMLKRYFGSQRIILSI